MEKTKNYRSDIDGLRAIAVLSVLIFHAFPKALPGGFVGVDIFFIISGFLISGLIFQGIEDKSFSFLEFYSRRIRRIFPALIAMTILVWIISWKILLPEEFSNLGKHIIASAAYIVNFTYWNEAGYFDSSAELKPLLHLWSLAIEEQFYFVWPLLLVGIWKIKKHLLKIILILIIASFVLNLRAAINDPTADFYLPQNRFWELLLGALLALWTRTRKLNEQNLHPVISDISSVIGLITILCSISLINTPIAYPSFLAVAPTLGTVFLIGAGREGWVNKKLLSNKVAVFIGLISYPLYLWHWPLLVIGRFLGRTSHSEISIAIILSFILAWLSFKFIETPLRTGSLGRNRLVPLSLFGVMTAIAALGGATWYKNGFPDRYSPFVKFLATYSTEFQFDIKYKGGSEYRYGTCFLVNNSSSQTEANLSFAEDCTDKNFSNSKNSVFLWGDSHAAQLYAGLKSLQKNIPFGLAQYTTGGCPPFWGVTNKEDLAAVNYSLCLKSNAFVQKQILAIKPRTVLLSAHWRYYPTKGLLETISELRKIGIENIVVLGPVPEWPLTLPKTLLQFVDHQRASNIPDRMTNGLDPEIPKLNKSLGDLIRSTGAVYVSAYENLCNEEGCLVRTGVEPEELVTFDNAHLTPSGSKFLLDRIKDKLIINH